jgi:hypothetical protein
MAWVDDTSLEYVFPILGEAIDDGGVVGSGISRW